MSHIRTDVREAIVALLIAGATNAAARVHDSRVYRFLKSETWPQLNVYTMDDRADPPRTMGDPYECYRYFDLYIDAIVEHNDDYAVDLDDLCGQVENLIPMTVGDEVHAIVMKGTKIRYTDEGENTLAVAQIQYEVQYLWESPVDGGGNIKDLDSIHTDWDMSSPSIDNDGPDGKIDAQDVLSDLDQDGPEP